MVEFELERIIKVGNESSDTISTLERAAANLGRHMTDLESALRGVTMQIPERFDNWQSVINTIKGDFDATQSQIRSIVSEAQQMLDDVAR